MTSAGVAALFMARTRQTDSGCRIPLLRRRGTSMTSPYPLRSLGHRLLSITGHAVFDSTCDKQPAVAGAAAKGALAFAARCERAFPAISILVGVITRDLSRG
jgi:hypothetical protein